VEDTVNVGDTEEVEEGELVMVVVEKAEGLMPEVGLFTDSTSTPPKLNPSEAELTTQEGARYL